MSELSFEINVFKKFIEQAKMLYDSCSLRVRRIIRVTNRFIKVSYITAISSIKYLITTVFSGFRWETYERHTKNWANKLVRELGIIILVEGDIPTKGSLLVANHRSYIDIPVLFSVLPGIFLAKKEVRVWPIFGFAARVAGTIFVDRSSRDNRRKAKSEIIRRIIRGDRVYVFPEGTTSEGPKLLEFKNGIFNISAQNNIEISPVAIQYADRKDAWIGNDTFLGHFFRTFAKEKLFVKVTFCKTIKNPDAESLKKEVHQSIYSNLPDFYEVLCDLETPT